MYGLKLNVHARTHARLGSMQSSLVSVVLFRVGGGRVGGILSQCLAELRPLPSLPHNCGLCVPAFPWDTAGGTDLALELFHPEAPLRTDPTNPHPLCVSILAKLPDPVGWHGAQGLPT